MIESFKAIVTEVDAAGISTFASREEIEPVYVRTPVENGKERTGTLWQVWGTSDGVPNLEDRSAPVFAPFFPGAGGTRFAVFAIPPDSWVTDRDVLGVESSGNALGIADSHEEDEAFHATSTIDYCFLVQGELVIELDGGERETLVPGSCLVQRGTRHAWRNESTQPALIASVIVGV